MHTQKVQKERKTHTKLCYAECIRIEIFLQQKIKLSEIAIRINKNRSTISRLLNEYGDIDHEGFWIFDAEKAWEKISERRRTKAGQNKVLSNELLEDFVLEKLELFWSPDQIAKKWTERTDESLSHETVYQYIYKYKPKRVRMYLRRKGKKYRSKREKKEKYCIPDMRMIGERPEIIEKRFSRKHHRTPQAIYSQRYGL